MLPLAILPSALENGVGALIASFRSSIPCPPMPLFYASLAASRQQQRQTRGRAARYSFLVGLSHPLLRTGLSRRSLHRLLHGAHYPLPRPLPVLVLAHDRRRILHFNVTAHPTAEWTGQQLREAFPFEQLPRYMLRDRDRIFGDDFREQVRDLGICEVLSAPRSPWQRAYVERVIGSIRRECLDQVIVFNENSLRRTLNSYFDYYHRSRTPSIAGEGLTGATSDSAAGNGVRRGVTAGRWVASPLRTTGCLKSQSLPGCELPPLGVLKSVSGTILTCTRVHRRISFAKLRQCRDLLTLFAPPPNGI